MLLQTVLCVCQPPDGCWIAMQVRSQYYACAQELFEGLEPQVHHSWCQSNFRINHI